MPFTSFFLCNFLSANRTQKFIDILQIHELVPAYKFLLELQIAKGSPQNVRLRERQQFVRRKDARIRIVSYDESMAVNNFALFL